MCCVMHLELNKNACTTGNKQETLCWMLLHHMLHHSSLHDPLHLSSWQRHDMQTNAGNRAEVNTKCFGIDSHKCKFHTALIAMI